MRDVPTSPNDITRTTLIVLCIGTLLLGSFWVIRPFFFAFLWATLIVVPLWPAMLLLRDTLGGRRVLAVAILTLSLLLLVLVPLWLALSAIVEHRNDMAHWIRSVENASLPEPPPWVSDLPLVGSRVSSSWHELAHINKEDLRGKVAPYLESFAGWIVSQIGSASLLFVHFFLTVIFSALLFLKGEQFAAGVLQFARRLGGDRGTTVMLLATQAVRAVAMGVVVTAFLQAFLAAIALFIVGIPYPILLAGIIFVLAVVQLGAGPVLVPLLIWTFWKGEVLWGSVLLVFSVVIMGVDNIVRPFLIQRGAKLPLLLIFTGVVGGLISFGIIGLFIGPIILAVSYTLLQAWVAESPTIA